MSRSAGDTIPYANLDATSFGAVMCDVPSGCEHADTTGGDGNRRLLPMTVKGQDTYWLHGDEDRGVSPGFDIYARHLTVAVFDLLIA